MSVDNSSGPDLGRPWQDPARYRAWPDSSTKEAEVFAGLSPRHRLTPDAETCANPAESLRSALLSSLPLMMTGTLTAGVAATGALPVAPPQPTQQEKASEQLSVGSAVNQLAQQLSNALHPIAHRVVNAIAPHIPDTYVVQTGDTISSIAAAHGLPTTVVLGLNGLHINSLVHEGQVLKLTTAPTKQRAEAPPRVGLSQYVIQSGDTVSSLAVRFGISQGSLLHANSIGADTTLIAGDILRIPGTRATTAPRAIPALHAAAAQSRVVWANIDTPAASPVKEPSGGQIALVSSTPETTEDETAAPEAVQDPLSVEIADAPALRVVKKAPPPPPPPPPPAAKAPEQRSSSNSSQSTPAPEPAPRQPVSGNVTRLNSSQQEHARTVIRVGRDLGVPDYGIVIALATAMQESSFRNISRAVDHDSLGLFQQRPWWWGTPEQLVDPSYATTVFFTGVRGPNGGFSRGLLGVSGWQNLPLTVAAQRVQLSAHPDAYAKWEASAWAWLQELG